MSANYSASAAAGEQAASAALVAWEAQGLLIAVAVAHFLKTIDDAGVTETNLTPEEEKLLMDVIENLEDGAASALEQAAGAAGIVQDAPTPAAALPGTVSANPTGDAARDGGSNLAGALHSIPTATVKPAVTTAAIHQRRTACPLCGRFDCRHV